MERFSVQTVGEGPHSRVVATGEIDLAVADRLWAELDPQITAGRTVVLDCSGVEFLDSMGLRTLIKALQKAAEVGASFRLADPAPVVQRVLELSGVSEAFA